MKNRIIKNSPYMWLGISLYFFANLNFYDWQFYAISIPLIYFISISNESNK